MKKKRVLITDAVHPVMITGFTERQLDIDYLPDIVYSEVVELIGQYEGLIINSKINCNKEFIDKGLRLEFIGRLGSGREVIDIPYAHSKGIKVYFSPEGNKNAVAEHALAMLLALSNQIVLADQEVRQKIWHREARRGWELAGKKIGIIGYGHCGSQFAKKLQGMEMEIMAYDKYLASGYASEEVHVREDGLLELLNKADIISLHLPLAADTYHFVDEDFFQQIKTGCILINTSRGNVIKTSALLGALQTGKLGGACLDVFENEKPNAFSEEEDKMYESLFRLKNVVLTPHIAGWTQESKYRLAKVLLDKIFEK